MEDRRVFREAEEQERPLVDVALKSRECESHSDTQKENFGGEADCAAHQEDPLLLMTYNAWQPEGGEGCHRDEGLVLYREGILSIIWVLRITDSYLNLAEHSQRRIVQNVAKEKSWEDEPACQTGDEDKEDKVGQRDQYHPRPDV